MVLSTLVLAAITFGVSEPWHALFEDFTDAYYEGARDLLRTTSQMEEVGSQGVHGFVNIPIIAAIFLPLAILPVWLATSLFTLLGIASVLASYFLLVRAAELDRVRSVLLALAFLLNGPLFNSIREGNTTHFALFAVVLSLVRLRTGREWGAGIILGVMAFFKLPLLLFGVYFLLRRHIRAAFGMGLTVAGIAGLSFAFLGVEPHIEWYVQFVTGSGNTPILAFNVQSILPLFVRIEEEVVMLCSWDGVPAGGLTRAAGMGLVLLLYAAAVASTLGRRQSGEVASDRVQGRRQDIEVAMVLVLACVTTPLAWTHYYAWMLVPIAFLLTPGTIQTESRGTRVLLAAATAMVSIPVVWPLICTPAGPLANLYLIFKSHYLFGGILLLCLLLRHRWRLGGSAA